MKPFRWVLIAVAVSAVAGVGIVALVSAAGNHTLGNGKLQAPTKAKLCEACAFGKVAANLIHRGAVGAVERRDVRQADMLKFALITVPSNLSASTTEMFAYLKGDNSISKAAALRDAQAVTAWLKACPAHLIHPLPPPA